MHLILEFTTQYTNIGLLERSQILLLPVIAWSVVRQRKIKCRHLWIRTTELRSQSDS